MDLWKLNEGYKELVAKMAEVMLEVGWVPKTGKNTHFEYTYASAEAVQSKFREAIARRGIVVSSMCVKSLLQTETRSRVKVALCVTDGVATMGPFEGIGEGTDKGDKSGMKAWTAACKYAIAAAILMSWGQDPEADTSVDADVFLDEIQAARSKTELEALGARLAPLATRIKSKDATRLRKAYTDKQKELG